MSIQLVIFDMDGVIFDGRNFWLDLHHEYATENVALELAARYLRDDYAKLAQITAGELWKDKPAAPFLELVRRREYQDGVYDVFDYLHQRQIRSAIVSSGPLQLAARAQKELGIDEVRANELAISDGRISGHVSVGVLDSEKRSVCLDVMTLIGVAPHHAAAVGDTESDVEVAKFVGLSIAYDSVSPDLDRVADIRLRKGELRRLVEVLDTWDLPDA